MKTRISYFCRVSGVFLPRKKPAEPYRAHFGTKFFWFCRRSGQHKKLRCIPLLFSLALICLIGLWVWHEFTPPNPILKTALIGYSGGLLVLVFAPVFLYSGFRQREGFLASLFSADSLIGFTLVASLVENFIQWNGSRFIFGPPESTLSLCLFCLFGFLWVGLRTVEAKMLSKIAPQFGTSSQLSWNPQALPYEFIRNREVWLMIASLSVLFISLALRFWTLQQVNVSASFILASLTLGALPYFQWLSSALIKAAEENGFVCGNFSDFDFFRKLRLLIFHSLGVISGGHPRVTDLWIDSHSDWTEAEVKDILFKLSEISDHPLSKAIRNYLGPTPSRSLTSIKAYDFHPHLGMTAEISDLHSKSVSVCFGGLIWHKIQQHEIDPAGFERMKVWNAEKKIMALLSLNRKIVAALCFYDELRSDTEDGMREFQKEGLPMVILSSHPESTDLVAKDIFVEKAVNLLPVERRVQLKFWLQREPLACEVKARQDLAEASGTRSVYLVDNRLELREPQSGFVSKGIPSVAWAIRASYRFFRKASFFFVLALGSVAVSAYIQSAFVTLGLIIGIFCLALCSMTLGKIK